MGEFQNVPQMYGTTLRVPSTGEGFGITTIPKRSLAFDLPELTEKNADQIVKAFGFDFHCTVSRDRIPHALLAVMLLRDPKDARLNDLDALARDNPKAFEFAKWLADAPIIPCEINPRLFQSISDYIVGGGGIGATIGVAAAGATATPLVIIGLGVAGAVIGGAVLGAGAYAVLTWLKASD